MRAVHFAKGSIVKIFTLLFVSLSTILPHLTYSKGFTHADTSKFVFALNYFNHSISVIDGQKGELINNVRLSDTASTFSVLPDGKLAVAITGTGDLAAPYKKEIHLLEIYDKTKNIFKISNVPDNLFVSTDGKLGIIYHSMSLPGPTVPITLIDLEKQKELRRFNLKGFTTGVEFNNNFILLYVAGPPGEGLKTGIYKLDLRTNTISEIMDLGSGHIFGKGAYFHKGKLYGLYGRKGARTIAHNNQTLQVIDLNSKQIEKILPLSDSPYSLCFVEDEIYVTHFNDGTKQPDNRVSIIDSKTYEIKDILEVGSGPAAICYSKSLGKVFTANAEDNSVSMIDVKSRKIIKTIPTYQSYPNVIRCPE